jgi:hypothetical protein
MELPKVKTGVPMPECKRPREESDEISMRDYFAAKVYAAMIAGGYWPTDATREDQASMAYKHADALIAERAK